jgi:hypothetical protein
MLVWVALLLGCPSDTDSNDTEDTDDTDVGVYGLDARPTNVACHDLDPNALPERLSATGCVDPLDPSQPGEALVPFSVASPLWSDGAVKERYVALPDGAALTVGADGDLSLPDGGVLAKWFHVDGELVEVRLIGRAGDSYATASWRWDAALGDGVLAPDGAVVEVGDLSWEIPSRYACSSCHTSAAGTSLGLELAQIQEDLAYPSGVTASQVATLEHIGFLTSTVDVEPLVDPHGDADLDARARSYLHTNCSGCHRPGGGTPFPMDLRATTALADTQACDVAPAQSFGIEDARRIAPGASDRSTVHHRMVTPDVRMPYLGTAVVDQDGAAVVAAWIDGLVDCGATAGAR